MIRSMTTATAMLLLASGCAAPMRKNVYVGGPIVNQNAPLSESLFAADQEVISNESIAQILSSHIVLPDDARIAVMQFGRTWGRGWWSKDVAKREQAAMDNFLEKLRAAPHVSTATIMPSMMTPRQQTIPHLRAAAARYQADMVFVYQATSQSYTKDKFLSQDEVKAYCLVEAVLLDTRTGIVPFTSVVARDYAAKKTNEDFNLTEAVQKAHMTAFKDAMSQVGDELVGFLGSLPAGPAES